MEAIYPLPLLAANLGTLYITLSFPLSLSLFPHSPHFSLKTSSPSSPAPSPPPPPPPSPPLPLPLSSTQTANKCLAYMIEEVNQLFMVSTDMLQACKFSYLEVGVPVPYTELGQDKYGFGDYRSYVEGCVTVMMKV